MYPTPKVPEPNDGSLTPVEATRCQKRLLDVFEEFNLHVGVGLTKHGVTIISQDQRVEARTTESETTLLPSPPHGEGA